MIRYAGLATGSEPAFPILVDTSDVIHVQLSKDYIASIREYMENDGDLADACIGSITIDGQQYPLLATTWEHDEFSGDNGRESTNDKYLYWDINSYLVPDPTVLRIRPRNDYTIEAINVVDLYFLE